MADYSTTIGVFQSQVGKSGDILLKFEHKNGGERGIRTLDTHKEYNDFRDRRLRPLSHLSAENNVCNQTHHLNIYLARTFCQFFATFL